MQKDGSFIVMESRYSSAPVLVNLAIQEKQCDGKTERGVRKKGKLKIKTDKVKIKKKSRQLCCHDGRSQSMEISQHSALYLWRWTLMKNTTRRPPLIIHSAPKQSQRGHLETKV